MLKVTIALLLVAIAYGYTINPGPKVIATLGEVWPKPQQQEKSDDYLVVRTGTFRFQIRGEVGCPDFLEDAVTRYWYIITSTGLTRSGGKSWRAANPVGTIEYLTLEVTGECASEDILPEFGDVENYTLSITPAENVLSSPSIWGLLHGLETFSQLIYSNGESLVINTTTITDFPRFPHRGLLLDTARHFIPVPIILQILDAMSYNKLNVFHWHISDDQSFPYRSRTFPSLSDSGAYNKNNRIYETADVKQVIEYARVRGIRVIPEFDTPGHTRSWGVSHPELLTACYEGDAVSGDLGPMDPSNNNTYDFINQLFTEVIDVFPDSFLHIGGDEVDYDCWESNPDIAAFMADNDIQDYSELENYFIQNVIDILQELDTRYLVWQEVLVNGVQIPNSTLVHVWRDDGLPTLDLVTREGKFALYSSCWYLDHLADGGDWEKFYECEPLSFNGTLEQKQLVLGGEACMWSEVVNQYNVVPRIWPRASAAAEKLWSAADVTDVEEARRRLEEHACRMNKRGIKAQPPNGPGVCL